MSDRLADPAAVSEALAGERFLADEALSVAVFLALDLGQPLLLEGEAGVGKTETAKALATATGSRSSASSATRASTSTAHCTTGTTPGSCSRSGPPKPPSVPPGDLFQRDFLLRRPLLEALEHDGPVVLLIDEIDRADDEFEAFLLELLSDFQVTIPELGTISAAKRPVVASPRTAPASCTTR